MPPPKPPRSKAPLPLNPVPNKADLADAGLAGQAGSPDASLTHDDGLLPVNAAGLSYPFADAVPGAGAVTRISDSLSWARIPMPGSLGHINSWLIDDEDASGPGVAAVDTGLMLSDCSDAWKALFTGALADQRITRILCTHMHPDHIGLAGWLAKRFDAPIYMTRGEWMTVRFILADARDEPPPEVAAMQRAAGWDEDAIAAARAAGWSGFSRVVFRLPYGYSRLVEGQELQFRSSRWRVVVGSGHSPEHACLYNAAEGVLISGDQILPKISSNISLSSTEPDADPLGEWLASIDRLLALPADTLVCPAHGQPFYGMHARLAALRDGHLTRLDILAEALTTPRRAVDCFDLLFSRPISGFDRTLATGEALAHLRRLEVAGRLTREDRDGVWWWKAVL